MQKYGNAPRCPGSTGDRNVVHDQIAAAQMLYGYSLAQAQLEQFVRIIDEIGARPSHSPVRVIIKSGLSKKDTEVGCTGGNWEKAYHKNIAAINR